MPSFRPAAFALLLSLLLSGCAGLWRDYEKPQVNITTFALAPESTGQAPVFDIGIQVINPNRTALSLKGMSYSLEVEGHRILSGATADLPGVPGYGMANFTIQASPNLFGSVRLFGDLFSRQRASLDYRFKARLDVGGLMPFVHLEESGRFSLPDTDR
ncbi:LEA type 2 family protein [Sedimenticola hydrogenitrophicus]|uniref:LEA type 2 family protein n=1 Tax=Sedimenticola hydrogenitrophicus TaxID=2967975 RepID=UPI0023B17260|nr:LEA type 2 family protein [Sedimenticola hydrogenitrophicus]